MGQLAAELLGLPQLFDHGAFTSVGRAGVGERPTRHNYVLGLWQNHIERILADGVGELAVPIHRAREVTGFTAERENRAQRKSADPRLASFRALREIE